MLKQRVVTAIILIALLVGSLIFLPTPAVAVVFGLFAIIAAWEWTRLSGLTRIAYRLLYVGLAISLGIVVYYLAIENHRLLTILLMVTAAWWLLLLGSLISGNAMLFSSLPRMLSGIIILVPAWASAVYLHAIKDTGLSVILFLIIVVGVADSAAFFVGRKWGRHKLAPTVSPGKTVEGMLGGSLFVLIVTLVFGTLVLKFRGTQLLLFASIGIVTGLFSVLGDLAESKYKRVAGIKDSGSILPGHGGVLDRIDAFTAAAPVYTLAWVFFSPNVSGS